MAAAREGSSVCALNLPYMHFRALHPSRLYCVALFAAVLEACSGREMIARFLPTASDQRARSYLALLARGNRDSAVARLVPELQTPDAPAHLDSIGRVLHARVLDSLRPVGVQVNDFSGLRRVAISYQLGDTLGWVVAHVTLAERDGDWRVEGVSAYQRQVSLEDENSFRIVGRPLLAYLWLVCTLIAAAFSLGVAIAVARTRQMPKRWRWVVLALIGVCQFSLNWSSGAWEFRALQFQLLSAGFLKSGPFAPWILSFALPLGAALSLRRLMGWRVAESEVSTHAGQSPSPEAAP